MGKKKKIEEKNIFAIIEEILKNILLLLETNTGGGISRELFKEVITNIFVLIDEKESKLSESNVEQLVEKLFQDI